MEKKITPTFWREVLISPDKIKLVERSRRRAHFISSRMSDGRHRLILDIDHRVTWDKAERTLDLGDLYRHSRHRLGSEWTMLHTVLEMNFIGILNKETGVIRFDHPLEVYPSATAGHFHLILHMPDRALLQEPVLWQVLRYFWLTGVIGEEWYVHAERECMAILVKRGVSKQVAYATRSALQATPEPARRSLIYVESPYGSDRSPYGDPPPTRYGGFSD